MRSVNSTQAPEPHGHYVQGQVSRGYLHTAMQLPVDRTSATPHHLADASLEKQVSQLLSNLGYILEAGNCSTSDIVRLTLYVASIDDWQAVNDAIALFLGEHKPARGVVAVPEIKLGYQIAADLIAEVPTGVEGTWATADLSDAGKHDTLLDFDWKNFGAFTKFSGKVETVKIVDTNIALRELLSAEGDGRVAVVEANGPSGSAVVGDQLANLAIENNWTGIVVFGRVRDTATTITMPLGIAALGTIPKKYTGETRGSIGAPILFNETEITSNMTIFVDDDGIFLTEDR